MRRRSFLVAVAVLAALSWSAAPARAEEAAGGAAPPEIRLEGDAAGADAPAAEDAPAVAGAPGEKAPPAEAGKAGPGETVHQVVPGDTLWDLSARYLKSPWRWKEIWERNRFLTNPHFIYPGTKVLIIPPPVREYTLAGAAPPPAAPPAEAPPPPPPSAPAAPPAGPPVLVISPEDFVRAGDLLGSPPKGIGAIRGGEVPVADFVKGDTIYLSLTKDVPAGQVLGVYRVRGPVEFPDGRRKGYVKYLVGVVQVTGKKESFHLAKVKVSYEELTTSCIVTEEIPSYRDVVLRSTPEKVRGTVVATRNGNKEISTGDFVYIDQGSKGGVSVGDRFRLVDEKYEGSAPNAPSPAILPRDVGWAVAVRTTGSSAALYVVNSVRSIWPGVAAVGIPGSGTP